MKKLCDLTDWQEYKAERGRGAGNSIKYRQVYCLDLWNHILAEEYPDGRMVGKAFAGNMRVFLTLLPKPIKRATVKSIIEALGQKMNMKAEINLKQAPDQIGKDIDDAFNVSFMREYPPTVYERVFNEQNSGS